MNRAEHTGNPWLEALRAVHDVLNLPEGSYDDAVESECDDLLAARAVAVTSFIDQITSQACDIPVATRRFREQVIKDFPTDTLRQLMARVEQLEAHVAERDELRQRSASVLAELGTTWKPTVQRAEEPVSVWHWTAWHATVLRRAIRKTVDKFADEVGVAPRTVANWAAHPDMVPRLGVQDLLDDVLAAASETARERFIALCGAHIPPALTTASIKSEAFR